MRPVLLLLCLAAGVLGTPVATEVTSNMQVLGKFGSKAFFEQIKQEKTNWMEARKICTDEKLEMALTQNFDEFNFLYNTSQRKTKADYWIAASQRGLLGELTYPSTDSTLSAFQLEDGSAVPADINFFQTSATWLCLYNTGSHHTFVDSCLTGKHHVLCQKTE